MGTGATEWLHGAPMGSFLGDVGRSGVRQIFIDLERIIQAERVRSHGRLFSFIHR